jgi:hypothetical protein
MFMVYSSWAFVALTTLLAIPVVHAQQGQPRQPEHTFNFGLVAHGTDVFEECATLTLQTIPLNTGGPNNSVPPYTVASFEIGGVPDYQWNVSTNATNIPWTVRHPSGSQVLITIIDGKGNNAGFVNPIPVGNGLNSSCLRPAPSNPPVLSNQNATDSIATCDHFSVSVTGGTPPYGAFIVGTTGTIITQWNSTSTATTTAVYQNFVSGGTQMIMAVQDSKGVFSSTTNLVAVKGPLNPQCKGTSSSWITPSQFAKEQDARQALEAAQRKAHTITVALAVVFSLLGAIVIGLGVWYWFRYRRNSGTVQTPFAPSAPPYDAEKALPIGGNLETRPSQASFRSNNSRAPLVIDTASAISGPVDLGRSASQAPSDFTGRMRANTVRRSQGSEATMDAAISGDAPLPMRSNSTSPFPAGRRPSRKAMEAAEERRLARERVGPAPPLPSADAMSPAQSYIGGAGPSGLPRRQPTMESVYSRGPGPSRNPSAAGTFRGGLPSGPGSVIAESEYDASDAGTIIIQHRDAGQPQVVVELPPAYAFDQGVGPRQSVPASAISPIEGGAGAAPRAM